MSVNIFWSLERWNSGNNLARTEFREGKEQLEWSLFKLQCYAYGLWFLTGWLVLIWHTMIKTRKYMRYDMGKRKETSAIKPTSLKLPLQVLLQSNWGTSNHETCLNQSILFFDQILPGYERKKICTIFSYLRNHQNVKQSNNLTLIFTKTPLTLDYRFTQPIFKQCGHLEITFLTSSAFGRNFINIMLQREIPAQLGMGLN